MSAGSMMSGLQGPGQGRARTVRQVGGSAHATNPASEQASGAALAALPPVPSSSATRQAQHATAAGPHRLVAPMMKTVFLAFMPSISAGGGGVSYGASHNRHTTGRAARIQAVAPATARHRA